MCLSTRCHVPCILIGPCRPKWMRVVDNFYSENSPDTQSKLRYYCLRQPDKLDRIAKYIYKRLVQDVHRGYDPYMLIAIDAINMLLGGYQGHRLVLAQVFLQMVHLLLQTNRTDLQILATNMFVEFSQIEDEIPNYPKEYNDLIDHFTSMAHASLPEMKERNKIRRAGICGIQGVVRKTVGGQFYLDVVHGPNMDKIIPSLLLNIYERTDVDPDYPQDNPSQEAVFVFKDIARRASYHNIEPVVTSILTHLDNHNLWKQPEFPLLIFQYLLGSIENTQIAHGLVKQLVAHLGSHESDFTLPERTCMVQVIGSTVISLAKGAIGPDVFHNFKSLLQILRASIDKSPQGLDVPEASSEESTSEERQFQDAIINTIAEFAKNLPDTQKIEILKFILNFEPMAKYHPEHGTRPRPLIMVLLQTMLTVATQYKTVAISNALNSDFLTMLLRGVAIDPDPAIRIIVQKILHTLIDRHGNTERLLEVRVYMDHPLETYFVWEQPSRQDILFMKKTGILLTENIYHQLLDSTNKVDCLEHLFCTVGLVALEMGADQVVVELFRLILAVQDKISADPPVLPLPHRCALHALLVGAMSLVVQLTNLTGLKAHVEQVIQARQSSAPYLLPAVAFNRTNTTDSYPSELNLREEWLLLFDRVSDALSEAGYDTSTLKLSYHPVYMSLYDSTHLDPLQSLSVDGRPYVPAVIDRRIGHHSLDGRPVTVDPSKPDPTLSGPNIYESPARISELARSESSYSLTDSLYSLADSAKVVDELLSFRNMQRILCDPNDTRKKAATLEEDRLLNVYNNTDFSDIFYQQRDKTTSVRIQMSEILDDIAVELHPNQPDSSSRKVFFRDSVSDLDLLSHPKASTELEALTPGYAGMKKKKNQRPAATWERDYSSLFVS